MTIYKITIKNQIKYLVPFILGAIVLVLINFIGGFSITFFYVTIIFFVLSGIVPLSMTHLHYLIMNKNVTLTIDYKKKIFHYNEKAYAFQDVKLIEMHQSLIRLKKGLQLLPTGDHHYSKVLIENGEILYITCLLASDFNLQLTDRVVYKPRLIASILYENLYSSDIY